MVFNIKHMFGGKMVEEYIQKIYEELLKEEQNSAKRISDLQIHLKETQAMIHLLEETNDPNFESFTPRKVNSRNKQKIDDLHAASVFACCNTPAASSTLFICCVW